MLVGAEIQLQSPERERARERESIACIIRGLESFCCDREFHGGVL